ncbi:Hypothetical protein, putative [Bodo saltans]|uniref:Uncharacterized protein n=1 Tax=Bodo saltans TaxID=75058 RepID=A0A0S4IRJ4_BODSA|nr:Hypothetical protein, putative [Bodo saltans]|eukprot:CUF34069.1 Hypothetical protein, putative [Bodo saltans]
MNFQLSICGLSSVQLQFHDIWPSLPIDDFVAHVLYRIRTYGSVESLPALERVVSQTCLLFSDDGTVRRLLCGPPPGLKSQDQLRVAKGEMTFKTCGEAFDLLDNGTRNGLRGWIYFAYQTQSIECHCKYRDDVNGFKAFRNSVEKHKHVEVSGIDLIFGDVLDAKRALVARGAFHGVEDVALLIEKSEDRCAAGAIHSLDAAYTSSSAMVELPNDELLFPLLREDLCGSVLVVQREGITVTVLVGAKRLLLPRFQLARDTVQRVLQRLRVSFHVASEHLFLEGREYEGAIQPSEQLFNLVGIDGEVHFSTTLPRPPPAPLVNEGKRAVTIMAASAHSPQRTRTDAPTLASASAVSAHASSSTSVARGQTSWHAPEEPLRAHTIAQELSNLSSHRHAAPHGVVLSEPPRITCRVDVSDCCSTSAQNSIPTSNGGGAMLVDVVLPDDGLVFTGRDLKQFLVSNHVISSQFASPADLRLIQGKRIVDDFEDLHAFVSPVESTSHLMHNATILLTCRRNR